MAFVPACMVAVALAVLYAGAGFWMWHGNCAAYPGIEHFWKAMLPDAQPLRSTTAFAAWFSAKLSSQYANFGFVGHYAIGYLPSLGAVPEIPRDLLNVGIDIALTLLALRVCVAVVRNVGLACKPQNWFGWSQPRGGVAWSAPWLFLSIAVPAALLMLVDVQDAFYRSHWVVLASALALAVEAASDRPQGPRQTDRQLRRLGVVLLVALAVGSGLAVRAWVEPELRNGYAGPGLPLTSDWSASARAVRELEARLGLTAQSGGIVVDDLTYISLRAHPRLQAITYLGLQSKLTGLSIPRIMRRTGYDAVIARCRAMQAQRLPIAYRDGTICASTLQDIDSLAAARTSPRAEVGSAH